MSATDKKTSAEIEKAGLALRIQLLKASKGHGANWMHDLEEADLRAIIAAMVNLGFAAQDDTAPEAARDTARSMVELKLAERMIEKMEQLDATTARLSKAALFVGFVGTVATLISVWPIIRAWVLA